jgi:hyperosmotically inducible periplasmic protein
MRFAYSLALALALGALCASCTAQQQQQSQHETKQAEVDAALAVRVEAAIAAQSGVNAVRVAPSVHDGAVVLKGTVSSEALHRVIVDAARTVPGVTSLTDEIVVKR